MVSQIELLEAMVRIRAFETTLSKRKDHGFQLLSSGEEAVAVGDGANDLPMMGLAGMGIAYRAKPIVRAQADHSITSLGLDGLLYLIGLRDQDLHLVSASSSVAAR